MARRPALTTVAVAALAAAAVVGAVVVVGSPATSSAQERTVTVARGVIQSTVSGSGNLEPANQADVDFATSGEITHIYIKAGDHVARDELLAKIDPDAANVELAQAQASLQSAQDALDQAQESAAASTTTATTAQSNGSTSASGDSGSSSGSASGSATSTMTVAAAQANVDSAQLSVTSAEKALAATTLRAPMAGTVTAVNGSVGTTVSGGASSSSASSSSSSDSGGASVTGGLGGADSSSSSSGSSSGSSFITLAQISRYKMEVSLSESDIGSVKVGQPATVTVNAASGEQFAARVTDIGVLSSSSSSGSSSAVSYPVTLSLDQTAKGLKAGMSATADVVTSQVTGIAVPSQALSGSTVTVDAADGTETPQAVQTGLVGDSTTQVVSGLKVGDKVVVRSTAAALGAAAGGSDQINNAIRSRLGAGGLGGAALGGGVGGAGFGGGGGGGFRGAGGGGGRTP
jgi:multidrug efflux pump subunit AcrA (membrane-fusion protein)